MVAKKIRALATDLPSIVRFDDVEARLARGLPPEEVWAEHLPLFQAGIPVIAGLVNIDAIVKEPNVVFVGFPLALAVGDGSPVRAGGAGVLAGQLRDRRPVTGDRSPTGHWSPVALLTFRAPLLTIPPCACGRWSASPWSVRARWRPTDLTMQLLAAASRCGRASCRPPTARSSPAPVSVSWEGPQPMQATLTGSGQRVDLGLRESPFEIDPSRFPRPGQYGIELRAPRFGAFIGADRRFMVRRARERARRGGSRAAESRPAEAPASGRQAEAAPTAQLQAERDQLRGEVEVLQGQLTKLREDNADLGQALDELQADTDARLAAANQEREALAREHLLALQENQFLRLRMDEHPRVHGVGLHRLSAPADQPAEPHRPGQRPQRRGVPLRGRLRSRPPQRSDRRVAVRVRRRRSGAAVAAACESRDRALPRRFTARRGRAPCRVPARRRAARAAGRRA